MTVSAVIFSILALASLALSWFFTAIFGVSSANGEDVRNLRVIFAVSIFMHMLLVALVVLATIEAVS